MKKTLFCLLAVIFVCASAYSITWSEAAANGEKNSYNLISAQKQLEASEWSYRKSFATFLPQISGSVGYSQDLITAGNPQSYSLGVSATENLFQGFKDIYGMQSAYAKLEFQRASYQASKSSVMLALRSAFVNLITAQNNVDLLTLILQQRQQNTKMIQLSYDGGNEDKGNLLSTQASEASARYDLIAARRAYDIAKLQLSQLIGQEVSGEVQDVQPSSAEAVDIRALSVQTPAYVEAKKTYEIADLTQKSTVSEFLPTISANFSDSKTGTNWPPDSPSKSWGLNLSYNLFPGGGNIADWAISAATLDSAREQMYQSFNDQVLNLKQAYENYRDSMDGLEVAKLQLAADTERAKISTAKYLDGLMSYDDWSLIQNSYIQSQKGVVSAKQAALLAEAAWRNAYGGWVK
jgi:outer membrane protein